MVYNPPVSKDGEGGEDPVTVTIEPVRMGDAYVEQAKRAAGWITLLALGWLFQRLMCDFGLPPHCDLPSDALEVLTDLLTLLVFGLAQVRQNNAQTRRLCSIFVMGRPVLPTLLSDSILCSLCFLACDAHTF